MIRADIDLGTHDLRLEIILVAVLGGDKEAVVGVRQLRRLQQDLASTISVEPELNLHRALVEAGLFPNNAAAAHRVEGDEVEVATELAKVGYFAHHRGAEVNHRISCGDCRPVSRSSSSRRS